MLKKRDEYVEALCHELSARTDYLDRHEEVKTIYFGGGTPSQLTISHVGQILHAVRENYAVSPDAEITFEANPSDISRDYADGLRALGINRVSLGIQSFQDSLLRFIGRRHDALVAMDAVRTLQGAGFSNISIDLIFGLPGQTMKQWNDDLTTTLSLGIQHISAYSLMYEEGTRLYQMLTENMIEETDEELSIEMYKLLIHRLQLAGYRHYEISNFALPDCHSRHNSSYWDGTHYLGVGAAAHSFDGSSRQWNVSDIDAYISGIESGNHQAEVERLTDTQRLNEMIMTRLRTAEGLNLAAVEANYGCKVRNHILTNATPYIICNKLKHDKQTDIISLTPDGILTSNDIIASLFMV